MFRTRMSPKGSSRFLVVVLMLDLVLASGFVAPPAPGPARDRVAMGDPGRTDAPAGEDDPRDDARPEEDDAAEAGQVLDVILEEALHRRQPELTPCGWLVAPGGSPGCCAPPSDSFPASGRALRLWLGSHRC